MPALPQTIDIISHIVLACLMLGLIRSLRRWPWLFALITLPGTLAHELLHFTVTFRRWFNWSRYLVALTSQSMEGGLAFRGLGAASAPASESGGSRCGADRHPFTPGANARAPA